MPDWIDKLVTDVRYTRIAGLVVPDSTDTRRRRLSLSASATASACATTTGLWNRQRGQEASHDARAVSARGRACPYVAQRELMLANHYYGHRSYLDRLNTNHTLYHPAAPWSQAEPAVPVLARRVWVLILDGLREDAADGLPTAIGRLSVRGVRRTLRSEFPTFTYPNPRQWLRASRPFLAACASTKGRPGVPLDGLYDVARRAGLPAFVTNWSHFTEALDRENADFLVQQKMDLAHLLSRAPTREMAWVHFEEIDEAGHR